MFLVWMKSGCVALVDGGRWVVRCRMEKIDGWRAVNIKARIAEVCIPRSECCVHLVDTPKLRHSLFSVNAA